MGSFGCGFPVVVIFPVVIEQFPHESSLYFNPFIFLQSEIKESSFFFIYRWEKKSKGISSVCRACLVLDHQQRSSLSRFSSFS
jgi:hypothetical protein